MAERRKDEQPERQPRDMEKEVRQRQRAGVAPKPAGGISSGAIAISVSLLICLAGVLLFITPGWLNQGGGGVTPPPPPPPGPELAQLRGELEKQRTAVTSLGAELTQAKTRITELEGLLAKSEEKAKQFEADLTKEKTISAGLRKEIEKLKENSPTELLKEITRLNGEVTRLDAIVKGEKGRTQAEVKKATEILEKAHASEIETQKSKFDMMLAVEKKKFDDLTKVKDELKIANDMLASSNIGLKKSLDTESEKYKSLAKESGEIQERIKILKAAQAIQPRPEVRQDPKLFATKGKAFRIVYRKNELKKAELICQVLDFKIEERKDDNSLICTWKNPITDGALAVLDYFRDVIVSVEPIKTDEDNGGFQMGQTPHIEPTRSSAPSEAQLNADWHLQSIRAIGKLPIPNPAEEVVIAVIDSGFDISHERLRDHLSSKNPERKHKAFKAKGAYREFEVGGDPIDPKNASKSTKRYIHGTHVAGIISRILYGPSGTDYPNIKLLLLKVDENLSSIAKAINYAASFDEVKIISLSYAEDSPSPNLELEDAILNATAGPKGKIIVCAAGNRVENEEKVRDLDQFRECTQPIVYKFPSILDWETQRESILATERLNYRRFSSNKDIFLAKMKTQGHLIVSVGGFGPRYGKSSVADEYIAAPDSHRGKVLIDLAAPGGLVDHDNQAAIVLPESHPYTGYLNPLHPGYGVQSAIPAKFLDDVPKLDRSAAVHGTSQAAPHVSAGLLLMYLHPNFSNADSSVLVSSFLQEIQKQNVQQASPKMARDFPFQRWLDFEFLREVKPRVEATLEPERFDPVGATKFFGRGFSLYWAGDYRGAITEFQAANQLNRFDSESYYYSAFAYANLGEYENASVLMERALDYDPWLQAGNSKAWGDAVTRHQGTNRILIECMRCQYQPDALHPKASVWWKGWVQPSISPSSDRVISNR